jgi:hypothetical protein
VRGDTRTWENDSPHFTYQHWAKRSSPRAHQGGYRVSSRSGATVRFAFRGSRFTWITARRPDGGFAEVRVDGVVRLTVDLYSATEEWAVPVVIARLTVGSSHHIEIRVTGRRNAASTGNAVVVDAITFP